jgi:hypothetical protein
MNTTPTMDNTPHVPDVRCAGTTRRGTRCPFVATDGAGHCIHHTQDDGARKAYYRALGLASARKRAERQRESDRIVAASLASAENIREALETALAEVRASKADAIDKANAVARLCGVALKIHELSTLGAEVRELRRLVEEREVMVHR